jgi:hypothetical protein
MASMFNAVILSPVVHRILILFMNVLLYALTDGFLQSERRETILKQLESAEQNAGINDVAQQGIPKERYAGNVAGLQSDKRLRIHSRRKPNPEISYFAGNFLKDYVITYKLHFNYELFLRFYLDVSK